MVWLNDVIVKFGSISLASPSHSEACFEKISQTVSAILTGKQKNKYVLAQNWFPTRTRISSKDLIK
jgi:hypothetical protein